MSDGYSAIPQHESTSSDESGTRPTKKKPVALFVILGIVVLLLIGGGVFCFFHFRHHHEKSEPFEGMLFVNFDTYISEYYNGRMRYMRSLSRDALCRIDYINQNKTNYYLDDGVYFYDNVIDRRIGHKVFAEGECTFDIAPDFVRTKKNVKCLDMTKYTPSGMDPPKLGKCDVYSLHMYDNPETIDIHYWVSGNRLVALEQQQLVGGLKVAEINFYFIKYEAKNVSMSEFDLPKDVLLVDLSQFVNKSAENKQPPKFNLFRDVASAEITSKIYRSNKPKDPRKAKITAPLLNFIHPSGGRPMNANSKLRSINPRRALDEIGENNIPASYDPRKIYGEKCPTISEILNQGNCGCCWAMASTTAFSDRVCIATNGSINVEFSTQHIMDCYNVSYGCDGGDPVDAWTDFNTSGVVSDECSPFFAEDRKCLGNECYDVTMKPVHHFSAAPYSLFAPGNWTENMRVIQADILKYGSVTASFYVMDDFYDYEEGVYHHKGDPYYDGGHSVKIIGWGETKDDKTPYWIIANSWGKSWGEDGFFRMIRGINDCGIEDSVIAGEFSR